MHDAIWVDVACSSEEEARRIAELLLDKHLAAACQMHPVCSLYWWEDQKHEADEWMLRALTRRSCFSKIKEMVFLEHAYKLPEVVSSPMQDVPEEYLR